MFCVLQGEEILSQRSQGSDDDDSDDGVEEENQRLPLPKEQSDDEVLGIWMKKANLKIEIG